MQLGLQPENGGYRKQEGGTRAFFKGMFLQGQRVRKGMFTECPGQELSGKRLPSSRLLAKPVFRCKPVNEG